ncbi:hypothetical protein GCM10023321_84880 [Pseudonocardia eucalypti]|uniref:Uncharacterized protein n=1 Tax=Pseudonocardia eucalypti TaxID=648755 RepID=A0ABP9RF06_9PSEU
MSLTAERIATADQVVLSTFEQTSVAWQSIPHWDTGDRGQSYVPPDLLRPGGAEDPIELKPHYQSFTIAHAQANADTPDALLALVIDRTVELAGDFDEEVLGELTARATAGGDLSGLAGSELLPPLIDARCAVEDNGYRAPSSLIANTAYYKAVHGFEQGVFVGEGVLRAAGIGTLRRSSRLGPAADKLGALLLGRRQGAADPSPGEEPVDLAVSVQPSLEVVGVNRQGELELGVRIRYATRVKDTRGILLLQES